MTKIRFNHASTGEFLAAAGTHEEGADDDEVSLLDVRRHVDEQREHADDDKVEQAKKKRQPVECPVVANHELARQEKGGTT